MGSATLSAVIVRLWILLLSGLLLAAPAQDRAPVDPVDIAGMLTGEADEEVAYFAVAIAVTARNGPPLALPRTDDDPAPAPFSAGIFRPPRTTTL